MNPDLTSLTSRLEHLEQNNTRLQADNSAIRVQFLRERSRFRGQAALALGAVMGAIFLSPANRAAIAQGYGVTLATLNTRLLAVEAKTQYVSVVGDDMFVTGTNLHIVNGLGATNGKPGAPQDLQNPVVNGKGNLIIGYNALRAAPGDPDNRSGSHNLILGDYNNYSSFGGMVAGWKGAISGPYDTVSGGSYNEASGNFAAVGGGFGNTASNFAAYVGGGQANLASGSVSSISGGFSNIASGSQASILGGQDNRAIGELASIGGGVGNTAAQYSASISGGYHNITNNQYATVNGGYENTAAGYAGTVSGGYANMASGDDSCVGGGTGNTAAGAFTSISGGGQIPSSGFGIIENSPSAWSAGGPGNGGHGVFHSP